MDEFHRIGSLASAFYHDYYLESLNTDSLAGMSLTGRVHSQ